MEAASVTDRHNETNQDEMSVPAMEMSSECEDGIGEIQQADDSEYAEMAFAESRRQLDNQWVSCRKNPGHVGFTPLDKFTMDHLPRKFQDNLILKLVIALASLTVRLEHCFISKDRPKTYRGRPLSFPHYKPGGDIGLVTGTGKIFKVLINTEGNEQHIYTCSECQKSTNANKSYARIWVRTSSHVVYDDSEAKWSTCVLSLDSPTNQRIKLKKACARDWWSDGDVTDVRDIYYETHDMDLARRLNDLVNDYNEVEKKVTEIYLNERDSLVLMVSHPHGQESKYVSIGNRIDLRSLWTREDIMRDKLTSHAFFTYNTPSCRGSSGAPLMVAGCCGCVTLSQEMCHSAKTSERGVNQGSLVTRDMTAHEWFLHAEAMEQSVAPELVKPIIEWYSENFRNKVLWASGSLESDIKACQEFTAQLSSEFHELLKNVPGADSDAGLRVHELAESWRGRLLQLCQELELSLERVRTGRDNGTLTDSMAYQCRKCLDCFLNYDDDRDGKLGYASFKSLLTCLHSEKLMVEGDYEDRLMQFMIKSLHHDSSRLVSLTEFTDLLSKIYDTIAKERWYLQKEAMEQHLNPELSEPVVTWYSESRFKLLHQHHTLDDRLKTAEILNAELLSESEESFLELFNKVPPVDLNTRECLHELALKWRHELQLLGKELEHSLKYLLQARDNMILTKENQYSYLKYLDIFLYFDKNRSGKIDFDHFKTLITRLRDNQRMRKGDPKYQYIQSVLDSLDCDRSGVVSLKTFAELLVKIWNDTFAEYYWDSLNKARKQGVEPEFSEPVVSWYSETRFKLLHQSETLEDHLKASKLLNAQLESDSEDQFLEMLKKVHSGDSNIRECLRELALRWRCELRQLCQDLVLALQLVMEARDNEIITVKKADKYSNYLKYFLDFHGNGNCKLDYCSFTSYMDAWYANEHIRGGDPRAQDIQSVLDSLKHDKSQRISLMEFTNLMLKTCNRRLAEDRWSLQMEAMELGIEPQFSEPVALWYSKARFQLLHRPKTLADQIEASELLTALMMSESEEQFLEWLNQVSPGDSNIREHLHEVSLKWRRNLQQLCQDLKLSLEQVMEMRHSGTITENMMDKYMKYMKIFLDFDKKGNGELDYYSFELLMARWCNDVEITEEDPRGCYIQSVFDIFDEDRTGHVSVTEFTALMLKICNKTVAKDSWNFEVEAIEQGVEPEFSKPVASWFSETRFKLLEHPRTLGPEVDSLEAWKMFSAQIRSESEHTFLELLDKVSLGKDSQIRECLGELALKWNLELQQMCEDLELSVELLMAERASGNITQDMEDSYLQLLQCFLLSDQTNRNGKLNYDSFKFLVGMLMEAGDISEGDSTCQELQSMVNSLDCDRSSCVSLVEFTDLLLRHAPIPWLSSVSSCDLPEILLDDGPASDDDNTFNLPHDDDVPGTVLENVEVSIVPLAW